MLCKLPFEPGLVHTPQHLGWRTKYITLVLRLTVFDLCKLSNRGPPFLIVPRELWPLILWPNRDNVTTGTLSLPVSFPNEWETKSILFLWSKKPTFRVPTNRKQLTTTTRMLRLPINSCVPASNLRTERPVALLTQTGVLQRPPNLVLSRPYLQPLNSLPPIPLVATPYIPITKWPINRIPSTLNENIVIGIPPLTVTPPVTDSIKVAPFTVGWVVTTTKLSPR